MVIALVVFDCYDLNGDGTISKDELKLVAFFSICVIQKPKVFDLKLGTG